MSLENNDRPVALERLISIANLAHAELHIGELCERTQDGSLVARLHDKIGHIRQIRKYELDHIGEKGRILWCTLKHLLLAYVSAHEMAAKTNVLNYYNHAAMIMTVIDGLLSDEAINEKNVKRCPRCEEKT